MDFWEMLEKDTDLTLKELAELISSAKYKEDGYENLCDILYRKLKKTMKENK